MLTIVSCWYILYSKHDPTLYKQWMQNFIDLIDNFYLVIYTNKESYFMLTDFLHKNVKIVIKEYKYFFCYKWKKKWIENHLKNDLLNHNSIFNINWKLNMIWNEKIYFVYDTYINNYFNSDYYIWCDIGYFREPMINKKWPNYDVVKNLNPNTIYYALVCDNNILSYYIKAILNNIQVPHNQCSISGASFIIHKNKLLWYKNIYYDTLSSFFEKNLLIKDDQYIILQCVSYNLNHFNLIKDTTNIDDIWFVFKKFLL